MLSNTDQRPEFTLDKTSAETWLRYAAAEYRGDDPPPGPRPEGELPEFDEDWKPRDLGQENEVYLLVRRAVDAAIIRTPGAGWDLDFEYVADDDGGYYYFLVRPAGTCLKL